MTCAVCRVEKILAGTFPVDSQDSTVDAVDTRVDRSLLGINIFLASAESHPVLTSQIFHIFLYYVLMHGKQGKSNPSDIPISGSGAIPDLST